jgi:serine/threonine protein phosphatase PrpC
MDRLIAAQNAWLADHNRRRRHDGAMTTLTALALHGQSYTLAHVGDTRAWRVRRGEGAATPLTVDHALDHPDLRSRLTRAVGLDDHVRVDYLQGELRVGDCFVLSTDGVHGVRSRPAMRWSTPRSPPAPATTPRPWSFACWAWTRASCTTSWAMRAAWRRPLR